MTAKMRRTGKQSNIGTTLVELIATFALISLFMVAATKVISNVVLVYYDAKGVSSGMQVSEILSSKIKGEIEGAMPTNLTREEVVAGKTEETVLAEALLIQKDSEGHENGRIEFYNHTGTHVYIEAKDGLFVMHYYPVLDEVGGIEKEIPAEDWQFDSNAYMGYHISELTFEQPLGDYDYNIIRMTLTLSSPKYGDYTTSEYIQCYNFRETDTAKIGILTN